jgi:hypothetical protein
MTAYSLYGSAHISVRRRDGSGMHPATLTMERT